jgi:hypothetical protein
MDERDDASEPPAADEPETEPADDEPDEHHLTPLDWVNQRRYGFPESSDQ